MLILCTYSVDDIESVIKLNTVSKYDSFSRRYSGTNVEKKPKVKPISAKIEAISAFPQPSTKKQVMRFLGMAGYYRKFFQNFSTVTQPLTELLRKSVKFLWTERCQSAFNRLKALLQSAHVLSAPDFSRPFKLAVDAGDIAASRGRRWNRPSGSLFSPQV